MAKQSIIQRDMRLMETREDFVEREDLDLRRASLRGARNMRSLATGVVEARPGLKYANRLSATAREPIQFYPSDGDKYGIILSDDAIHVVNENGGTSYLNTNPPWTSAAGIWVVILRNQVIVGASDIGIYVVQYEAREFTLEAWTFSEAVGAEIAQPYWAFNPGVTLQPSNSTGAVTIVASESVFTEDHAGLRLRYAHREILITEFLASNALRGEVVTQLPPSFRLRVDSTSEVRVGDVLTGNDTNWQGVVTMVENDHRLRVVTLSQFDGPEDTILLNEELSGPSYTIQLEAGGKFEIAPQPTEIWDEPMMSDARGWPRSAAVASERLTFVDFPLIPDGVALSSNRALNDFKVGSEDDDAIARQIGDAQPRIRHVINAGDLLFLTDRGCYLIPLRNDSLLTPSTFNAILFDDRGCNGIKPVRVNDGVVFVESNGENVAVALLDGTVQLKWRVRALTVFHNHLIKSPVSLCGPSLESSLPEKYVLVVNGDGTMAALSYASSLKEEGIGVAPWDTDGNFISAAAMFGNYWAVVDREVTGGTVRLLESFEDNYLVDCGVEVEDLGNTYVPLTVNGADLTVNGETLYVSSPHVRHIPGHDVYLVEESYVQGPYTVNSDGTITDLPEVIGKRQIGLNFVAVASPWSVENIESPRVGTFDVRCIRFLISIQNTGEFQVRCNNDIRSLGGYSFGDLLSKPPPVASRNITVPVFGRRTNPDLAVIKNKPGTFRILYLGQEVQY